MAKVDYDDMDSRNNRRGHRATRMTVLVSLFVILLIAIIIVLYVIFHPNNEISIKETKNDSAQTSSETETPVVLFKRETIETESSEETVLEEESGETLSFSVEEEEVVTPQSDEIILQPQPQEDESPAPLSIVEEKVESVKEDITQFIEEKVDSVIENIPSLIENEIVLEEENEVVEEEVEEDAPEDTETPNPLLDVVSGLIVVNSSSSFDDDSLVLTGLSGSAVHSLKDGRVVKSGKENSVKYVIILSPDGDAVKYSGFERVTVHLKDRIKKGDIIGSIGTTGDDKITLEYIAGYEE